MSGTPQVRFDSIGSWSEVKLDIIKEYASAYSRILSAQPHLYHIYIEGFAGSGVNLSRKTGKFVRGSPLNALLVKPPFREYHYIDIEKRKKSILKSLLGNVQNVHIYPGDCNSILLQEVFPLARYADFRRALCVLDPYGLHLDWNVIRAAGSSQSIDIFLNFPVMDMNRKVIWHSPAGVNQDDINRMNAFWGDESWREIAYTKLVQETSSAFWKNNQMRSSPRHFVNACWR